MIGCARRAALLSVAVLAAVHGAWADKIDVRATTRGDTGRLSLAWPKPVDFDARSADGQFTLRFERPADGDFTSAVATLRQFLGAPDIRDGGRTLAFPLRPGVSALTFADKRRVVVDLFAGIASERGAPVPAPHQTSPDEKQGILPVVQVRRGEHRGFSRIVFDWTAPVGYVVEKRGASLFVTFDKKADFDLSALASRPLRHISGVRASLGDITSDVAMAVADTSKVRDFRQDNMVAIDVYAPVPETSEGGTAAGAVAGIMRPVAAPNRVRKAEGTPAPTAQAGARASAESTAAAGGGTKAAERADVQATGEAAVGELRFDWQEPVAAAVFRRAGSVWIVFDRPSVQDLEALRAAAGDGLQGIEQRPHPRATVLRLVVSGDRAPVVHRDGLAWIVSFDPDAARPIGMQPALAEQPDGRKKMVLPVAEPGLPLALTDPLTGGSLVVVPVVPLGHGVMSDYTYPQARLLASAQGIAIRPLVDDLRVRSGREEVALTTPDGFSATPVSDAIRARASLESAASGDRVLDLAAWSNTPLAAFTPARQSLEAAAAAAEAGAPRERALLRLASVNLAHGFAAETLGVVARAALERPAIEDEAEFRMLRGAAQAVMGRSGEALADLGHASLAGKAEAGAWRTAVTIARGEKPPETSERELAKQAAIVSGYPRVLQKAVLGSLAQAAIAAEAPALSDRLAALLAAEAATPGERAEAAYVEGLRLAAKGDTPGAVGIWKEIESNPASDRANRVRAVNARVRLELAKGEVTAAEAIAELERLDFAWRGDRLELAVLNRLSDLYLAEKRFPEALRTLRRIATNYPDAPGASDVAGKLTRAFEAVLIGENSEALSPLATVALYDEFRELTPAGPRGDALIGAVADKMVELDLLGRAAALLDTQVRYRLSGAERARTGARLASLHLLDGKPDAALRALDLSAEKNLAKPLAAERSCVRARALSRLGRHEEALEPLETLDTPEAAAIRADIFWSMGDWRGAARSIARVLERNVGPGREPDEPQGEKRDNAQRANEAQSAAAEPADEALHLAVALALAGDDAGLAKLGSAYGPAMAKSRWRDVFPLIVADGMPTANLEALARDIGPIDSFRKYLSRPAPKPKPQG